MTRDLFAQETEATDDGGNTCSKLGGIHTGMVFIWCGEILQLVQLTRDCLVPGPTPVDRFMQGDPHRSEIQDAMVCSGEFTALVVKFDSLQEIQGTLLNLSGVWNVFLVLVREDCHPRCRERHIDIDFCTSKDHVILDTRHSLIKTRTVFTVNVDLIML